MISLLFFDTALLVGAFCGWGWRIFFILFCLMSILSTRQVRSLSELHQGWWFLSAQSSSLSHLHLWLRQGGLNLGRTKSHEMPPQLQESLHDQMCRSPGDREQEQRASGGLCGGLGEKKVKGSQRLSVHASHWILLVTVVFPTSENYRTLLDLRNIKA